MTATCSKRMPRPAAARRRVARAAEAKGSELISTQAAAIATLEDRWLQQQRPSLHIAPVRLHEQLAHYVLLWRRAAHQS